VGAAERFQFVRAKARPRDRFRVVAEFDEDLHRFGTELVDALRGRLRDEREIFLLHELRDSLIYRVAVPPKMPGEMFGRRNAELMYQVE